MEKLFSTLRELCAPPVWSAGVEMARTAEVLELQSAEPGERTFRLHLSSRAPVISVSLNEDEEAWQCSCADPDDPCRHVVATAIAVRQGLVVRSVGRRGGMPVGSVVHSFQRNGNLLRFLRFIEWGDTREELSGSLGEATSKVRLGTPTISVTREEEAIDHVLPQRKSGVFDPKTLRLLLTALARVSRVELDGALVQVSAAPLAAAVEVIDDGDGFRVRRAVDRAVGEVFENGAALRDGILCALDDGDLSRDEWESLTGEGRSFPRRSARELASVVIPRLSGRVDVHIKTDRLPRVVEGKPRILIECIGEEGDSELTIVPHLEYGDPVIAEVIGETLAYKRDDLVPLRDRVEEARLIRELQADLGVRLNEARVFRGEAAHLFARQLKRWETRGSAASRFMTARQLSARVVGEGAAPSLLFETEDRVAASEKDVIDSWQRGARFVQLVDGSWGELPRKWLEAHRSAIIRLLDAREKEHEISAQKIADVQEICDSLSVPYPEYFERIRKGLSGDEVGRDIVLPTDLTAALRPYQETGVRWLSFLRELGIGALLADDMGLGKTLQAMCVLRGRTLVVAPTSVLFTWEEQLARFRPSLKVCRYHGANRNIDPDADLIITTYAILRLDTEILSASEWDTIILDESQTIRNPDSQVARAAYSLKGRFKINLSGTPVENSLEDLWSQFHFLNPGLLGNRSEFEASFGEPIRKGDEKATVALRQRVLPFMLRRLKKEVAKELPPKTEVVLECELSESERAVYDAVLGSSRREVVEALRGEGDMLSVLEVLLRLRQACCHVGLVPGQHAATSSKSTLLLEALEQSILQGHRALVFSQWTSFLDLIEPALQQRQISWSRIDGSTRDRESIVQQFQAPTGPSVLLLSLKAGGVGLNLTAADHVYILDPWWNPAVEDQAADRAYRIGQENPVIVHRLVARDTIEERVLSLQEAKRALLTSAMTSGEGVASLTRDDVARLLGMDTGSRESNLRASP